MRDMTSGGLLNLPAASWPLKVTELTITLNMKLKSHGQFFNSSNKVLANEVYAGRSASSCHAVLLFPLKPKIPATAPPNG